MYILFYIFVFLFISMYHSASQSYERPIYIESRWSMTIWKGCPLAVSNNHCATLVSPHPVKLVLRSGHWPAWHRLILPTLGRSTDLTIRNLPGSTFLWTRPRTVQTPCVYSRLRPGRLRTALLKDFSLVLTSSSEGDCVILPLIMKRGN